MRKLLVLFNRQLIDVMSCGYSCSCLLVNMNRQQRLRVVLLQVLLFQIRCLLLTANKLRKYCAIMHLTFLCKLVGYTLHLLLTLCCK